MYRSHIKGIVLLFFFIALGTTSCAPPFPKQVLEKVDRKVTLRNLKENPERLKGTWVMMGGVIVDSKSSKDGNYIEVLQRPLGRRGRPEQTDDTEGRLLIFSQNFLDPAVYQRGRLVTVIGEVIGEKVLPLGEIEYHYPLLRAESLHLWEPYAYTGPTFHLGIGVFHSF